MTKPQDLIQPRLVSYFRSSLYTRWILIALVLGSFWFLPDIDHGRVAVLAVIATSYNLLMMAGARHNWTRIIDQRVMLVSDSLLSLLLVVFTGGIASPYMLVLVPVVVSGAYWYGLWISLVTVLVQSTVLVTQEVLRHPEAGFPESLAVEMLILAAVGYYVALLTGSERSERKQLIAVGTETEKERQQLLALINNMGDAVLVVDNDNKVVIHNQAAATLAGSTTGMHGRPFDRLLEFLDADNRPAALSIKGAEASEQKGLRVKAADGSLMAVSVNIAPYIVDRQNRGHVLIIHNVSQETTIDQERKEFIALASHELRTPLTIAQGDISFLLSPEYIPKNPESVEMLNSALRSLKQLSHIINDLTNLAQVENEELDVQLEPLKPVELLKDFQSDYGSQASDKGVELDVKIDPKLHTATILTSRYVVGEILSIFMTNAMKFTEKGTITLELMNPEDEASGVTFAVSDTGPGISQSDQKKIFKKFFQSEDYSTRVHGGTGLGLYIAHQLADRITGKTWFETELGKGSTFYLWVPPYSKHEQDRGKIAAAETKDFFDTV
ncbi:MAG TPA: ATP-binding protein [Candidatus Saccharimonadales bacterium]|nr:ATP-binding protein [Candidatus Saccharimonadales bacterium]